MELSQTYGKEDISISIYLPIEFPRFQTQDHLLPCFNKDNPCRCARKTKGFIERGIVDPENLLWDKGFSSKIEDYTMNNLQDILISSDTIYSKLYQAHPFKENKSAEVIIDSIIADNTMREILDL